MLSAFANTFKIPELRQRILFTIGLIFICRLVSLVPTPGVNWQVLEAALNNIKETSGAGGGLMGMFDVFSGGAMSRCSVGFLSIWPYISASIILQLMTAIIPTLERLAREGDSGRQKLNQYTRYFTIVICIFQGYFLARALENPAFLGQGNIKLVDEPGFAFQFLTVIAMTTASMLVMWLGDQITARGIGNGISLIIMINIVSRLPIAIIESYDRYFSREAMHSVFELAMLLGLGFLVTAGTVMLTQGLRKIPIHTARRTVGAKAYGGQNTYMPLRVNYSGVMPIIFAGPLLQFPAALMTRIDTDRLPWLGGLKWLGGQLVDMSNAIYLVSFSVLVLFFSFFWVATQFNAMRISDDLKRTGGYVPGIRPGRATAEYLDHTMTRVTLIGAIGLIAIAILPTLLRGQLNLPWELASFFGGTSLLIIVGVALDTLRQMESLLLMRHYDGFLKHGRLRSRKQ
ncbi:MAG: preprotein translocase subunit SecY [Kiritimatiellae bacterium]|nr:preprotein translocase subunit SecY [Kiritimatiellia bacterium]